MIEYDIAVLPGDGIGPEVTREAMRVVEAAAEIFGFRLRRTQHPFGSQHFLDTGELFPDAAFEEVKQSAIFLGAIGDPRLPSDGSSAGSSHDALRARPAINLRPVSYDRTLPAQGKGPDDVDGVRPREHRGRLRRHVRLRAGASRTRSRPDDVLHARRCGAPCATLSVSRAPATEETLMLIDRNAVRAHDLWTRVFADVAREYPDVKTDHAYIDAACMWMVKNPEWFDVAVCPNLMGDIITDLGAMIQGGMGVAASGNIHPGHVSLFEPIHGSAPKHAGKNVACPVAAILAGAMMLGYLGQTQAETVIEGVVIDLIRSKKLKGVGTGDHPTSEVGEMVLRELRSVAAKV
jgi:3-isopropylmalate dehydrogenase